MNVLQGVEQKMTYVNSSSSRNSFHLVCSKGLSPLAYFGGRSSKVLSIEMFLLSDVSGIVFEAAFGL